MNETTKFRRQQLASCLIYARTLLEYVIFIMWLRSVIKMLQSVKFAEDKVLTFIILRPIICQLVACAANKGVVVCGRVVRRKGLCIN